VHGWHDRFSGTVRVRQLLRDLGGTYADSPTGEFVYHNRHDHWHWQGFSRYEILALLEDGSPGEVLASSEKVGFCLRDDERMPGYLLGFPIPETQGERPRARFGECGWQKQGLSPGWVDVYGYQLDGQSLDDGIYLLKTLVDPGNLLLESQDGSNAAQVYFGLYGERLVVFGVEGSGVSGKGGNGLSNGVN